MNSLHAVAVLIISPNGTPLIRDPKKPAPRYWKLPGGRSNVGETREECAAREIEEELGFEINPNDLEIIDEQDRGNHTLTFFRIRLKSLQGLKSVGNEGEEIKIFKSLSEITKMPDLFPNHKGAILKSVE